MRSSTAKSIRGRRQQDGRTRRRIDACRAAGSSRRAPARRRSLLLPPGETPLLLPEHAGDVRRASSRRRQPRAGGNLPPRVVERRCAISAGSRELQSRLRAAARPLHRVARLGAGSSLDRLARHGRLPARLALPRAVSRARLLPGGRCRPDSPARARAGRDAPRGDRAALLRVGRDIRKSSRRRKSRRCSTTSACR